MVFAGDCKQMTSYKKLLGLFAASLAFAVATTSMAFAQSAAPAPQTCDVGVWKTMEERARLETEREIMQNQNLIFKADSVLTYTCFDSLAAHAVQNVGGLFTHTSYWNGTPILPWAGANGVPGLGTAVQNAVINAMKTYIQGAFNHSLLGGRGTGLGLPTAQITAVGTQGAPYACSMMNTVWNAAKCMNFMHTPGFANTDGFYPFKDLQGSGSGPNSGSIAGYQTKRDTRQLPTTCPGQPVPPTGSTATSGWAGVYNATVNANNLVYPFAQPTGQSFQNVRAIIAPTSGCGNPIMTGISVVLDPKSTSTYPDGICVAPGCSYTKNRTCQ